MEGLGYSRNRGAPHAAEVLLRSGRRAAVEVGLPEDGQRAVDAVLAQV